MAPLFFWPNQDLFLVGLFYVYHRSLKGAPNDSHQQSARHCPAFKTTPNCTERSPATSSIVALKCRKMKMTSTITISAFQFSGRQLVGGVNRVFSVDSLYNSLSKND